MIFTSDLMKIQFDHELHSQVREVITELDEALNGGLRITEVGRSDDDSERIYMQIAQRLLASGPKVLGPLERAQWEQIEHLSPVGLKQWCRLRPSWHKPMAGVDLGLSMTSEFDRQVIGVFLRERCEKPMWELIVEPHGTGPHVHLARRDYEWLRQFPGSLRKADGKRDPSS